MKYSPLEDLPLLDALKQMAPDSSQTTRRSWIKEGRIAIDGVICKLTARLVGKGQLVTLEPKTRILDEGMRILYEDKYLVVVDKPSGLLSVATHYEKEETAHSLLKEYYRPKRVFPVHRLDQDTSGVLVFALDEPTREGLKDLFEAHTIEREYIAVVEGKMSTPKGTWSSYLYEDEVYYVRETDDEQKGRLAITHYETLASSKKYSLLSLRLETGRKNQIRVHCQSAGHSVVGDKKYGALSNPLKRLALHARLLAFKHPISYKEIYCESSLPEEFHFFKFFHA